MAQWHLDEVRKAVEKRGWHCVELPGDERWIAATWQLCRPRDPRIFFLDFANDDSFGLPIERTPHCTLRGTKVHIHFNRLRARHIIDSGIQQLMETLES